MAKSSVARRNAVLDAIASRLNNGYLRFYSGTRPTDPDTALSGNTLLAELRFNATAQQAASAAAAVLNAITSAAAAATGTVVFARALKSDGTTAEDDYSVGTSGTDITVDSTSFVQNVLVSASGSLTQPQGT